MKSSDLNEQNHISDEDLINFVGHIFGMGKRKIIEAHLAKCDYCLVRSGNIHRRIKAECEKVKGLFEGFLDRSLSKEEMNEVEIHLHLCQECLVKYEMFAEEKPLPQVLFSIPAFKEIISIANSRMIDSIQELLMDKKGMPYLVQINELNGLNRRRGFLNKVEEKLGKENIMHLAKLDSPFIDLEELPQNDKPFILLSNAPRLVNLDYLLSVAKRPAIATGSLVEWYNTSTPINSKAYLLKEPGGEEIVKLEQEAERLHSKFSSEEVWKFFIFVCSFGRFGLPISAGLIARVFSIAEEESINIIKAGEEYGLYNRHEQLGSSGFVIPKNDESIVEKILEVEFKDRKEEELEEIYKSLIRNAIFEDTIYIAELLYILTMQSQKRSVIRILEDKGCWEKLISKANVIDIITRFNLARVCSNIKKFDKAEVFFDMALEIDPENKYVLHSYAKMLGEARRYDEAEKRFNDLKKVFPKNIYLYQAWGDMEAKGGWSSYQKAQRHFQDAWNIDKSNIHTLVAWGNLEAKWRYYRKAEEKFQEALQVDEENLYALNSYGVMEAERLNYDETHRFFEQALEIEPVNLPTLNAKARIEKDRGHLREAERLLQNVLEIDPENLHSMNALAEIMVEKGDFKEAERLFEEALNLDPNNIHTLVAWGNMEVKKDRLEKAEKLFNEAIDKENAYVYISWANMMVKKNDYVQAEKLFNKALENPSNPIEEIVAYNNIAKMWADRKNFDNARWFIKKSMELLVDKRLLESLERIITLNTWAEIEKEAANYEESERLFKETLELDKDNAYTHRAYADMLKKAGKEEEAKEHLEIAEEFGLPIE